MTFIDQFIAAMRGWLLLARHRPGWRELFVPTEAGLMMALVGYFFVVVIGILFRSLFSDVPGPAEFAASIGVNALPLVGLVLSLFATRVALRFEAPVLGLLVPAVHLLTALLLAGFVLTVIGGGLATLLLVPLGYLFYRGAREILGLNFALALAYAALTIVVLVALPTSLYMLMAPGPTGTL
jgi:hypothetical protein